MAETPSMQHHTRDNAEVAVEVADSDRFAVAIDRIRVRRADGTPTAPTAPGVAERLDYLGERLRLIETEPDEALVRSAAPVPTPEGREYYELRFEGDGVTMERRAAREGGVTSVPFVVPHGTLDRLVDDLGTVVGREPPAAEPPAPAAPPPPDDDLHQHRGRCC